MKPINAGLSLTHVRTKPVMQQGKIPPAGHAMPVCVLEHALKCSQCLCAQSALRVFLSFQSPGWLQQGGMWQSWVWDALISRDVHWGYSEPNFQPHVVVLVLQFEIFLL